MFKRFEPIANKCGEILEYVMTTPDVIDMPQDFQFKVRLCAEEAIENIVQYAYSQGEGFVEVESTIEGESFVLSLKDAGKPFNPLDKHDPDINASLEEREIGGLGIFLCKQLMDSINYKYSDGCNILTMSLKIS